MSVTHSSHHRISVKQTLNFAVNFSEEHDEKIKTSLNDSFEIDVEDFDREDSEDEDLSRIETIQPLRRKKNKEKRGSCSSFGRSLWRVVTLQFISNHCKLYLSGCCYWALFIFIIFTSYLLFGHYAHLNMNDYT
mmetsp:Transcript_4474/g.6675  ORF Transcript_4474/g.6675 Transcript_4474/m.6675 type:complete len:134 (+) Transcript_4474:356-757(+)